MQYDARHASDPDYADRGRHINADTSARFNVNARRLFEASGCAGKLAVFYINNNDPTVLSEIRRHNAAVFHPEGPRRLLSGRN